MTGRRALIGLSLRKAVQKRGETAFGLDVPEERGGVWGSCMAAEGDEKLTVQLSTNKHAHREKKAMLKTESNLHYFLLKLMMTFQGQQ